MVELELWVCSVSSVSNSRSTASKRKGMWMGGVPPLGYAVRDRRLVVSRAEAKTVRHIYERYLELGCVRQKGEDRR